MLQYLKLDTILPILCIVCAIVFWYMFSPMKARSGNRSDNTPKLSDNVVQQISAMSELTSALQSVISSISDHKRYFDTILNKLDICPKLSDQIAQQSSAVGELATITQIISNSVSENRESFDNILSNLDNLPTKQVIQQQATTYGEIASSVRAILSSISENKNIFDTIMQKLETISSTKSKSTKQNMNE